MSWRQRHHPAAAHRTCQRTACVAAATFQLFKLLYTLFADGKNSTRRDANANDARAPGAASGCLRACAELSLAELSYLQGMHLLPESWRLCAAATVDVSRCCRLDVSTVFVGGRMGWGLRARVDLRWSTTRPHWEVGARTHAARSLSEWQACGPQPYPPGARLACSVWRGCST